MPATEPVNSDRLFARRLSVAVLAPIVASAICFTWLLTDHAYTRLERQKKHFGQAIADQLAISVADQVINEDILSLNVLLSDLVQRGDFDFASVYSADNRLLAQAGRRTNDTREIYTRDVTFQNATAGFVQVGLDETALAGTPWLIMSVSLSMHVLLAGLVLLAIFHYRGPLQDWLSGASDDRHEDEEENPAVTMDVHPDGPEVTDVSVLVIRLRPARLIPDHRGRIGRALSLYGGVITDSEGDDINAVFSAGDQVFHAVCGGLLVKSIIDRLGPPLKFNAAIHTTSTNDLSMAQKHASYLASITEARLLTSRRVYQAVCENDRITMQEFHSSLTPDGEVYSVISLAAAHQTLIEKQAAQLS